MNIFDFSQYRPYLNAVLPTRGLNRGMRKSLATFLSCQSGFISQVLKGDSDFSLEHALKINRFLKHSDEEGEYFLLLVQRDKAGSEELKHWFERKLTALLEGREEIKERLRIEGELNESDQATYYSHWYYAAIHMLVSLDDVSNSLDLANRLNLRIELIHKALSFLRSRHLINEDENGKLQRSKKRIHLSKRSPLIQQHHINWRLEAIKSLETGYPEDIHYSGVITLSKRDAQKMRRILIDSIESSESVLGSSTDEVAYAISLDYFEIGKKSDL